MAAPIPVKNSGERVNAPRRKIEGPGRAEMRQAGEDDPGNRDRHSHPEQLGELANHGDAAIEQKDNEGTASPSRQGCPTSPRC